ncbi:MAG: hypothetical protein WC816_12425 [Sphingomonas sp.]|jgi:hypothetical protein
MAKSDHRKSNKEIRKPKKVEAAKPNASNPSVKGLIDPKAQKRG